MNFGTRGFDFSSTDVPFTLSIVHNNNLVELHREHFLLRDVTSLQKLFSPNPTLTLMELYFLT